MTQPITALDLRKQICSVVQAENKSRDSLKYWSKVLPKTWRGPPPPHWCGAFALWALRTTLLCSWTWEIHGVTNNERKYGFLFRLPKTATPQPGDICYQAEPYQHHGVLLDVLGNKVISQDGNTGPSPGICAQKERPRSQWTAFYSIEPLLSDCLASPVIPAETLRRGSPHVESVSIVQRALGIVDDGAFGPKTEAAVREFQRRNDLVSDGVVGQMTWQKLLEVR
jgi:hypothetical protein